MSKSEVSNFPLGVWYIVTDKDGKIMAQKTFDVTDGIKQITVPFTKEIGDEIKKQINAQKLFLAFQKLDINDDNIIGYLNFMLSDCVNFLDSNSLDNFIIKMQEIASSEKINMDNATFIQTLIKHLKDNNVDSFCEVLEQFQSYNFATNLTASKQH